ncbi:MAG TPA: hypothetical protein VJB94_04250 [Candidatus Nanoarchaeia archaeon]|nr:hypothetical protein [Candidatus Nanoarchaeia archaeon]
MGAASYRLMLGKKATLYLKSTENKLFKIDLKEIQFGLSTQKGKKKEDDREVTPSIIGTDFLRKNNFSLYFNPNKNEAYLDKED